MICQHGSSVGELLDPPCHLCRIEELEAQLAAMTQERDAINATIMHMNDVCNEQLAASQAREQQLREALNQARFCLPPVQAVIVKNALALPTDDTALRQWGAKLLREMADLAPRGHYMMEILVRKADELEG